MAPDARPVKPPACRSVAFTTNAPSLNASPPPMVSVPSGPANAVSVFFGNASCSISIFAPAIGVVRSLPSTWIAISPRPTSRTDRSTFSPAFTVPWICPALMASSSTVSVKLPAFTTGKPNVPAASVTASASWIPCGIVVHSSSPLDPVEQTILNSADL